jgi:AcrR family transcriptional regulator
MARPSRDIDRKLLDAAAAMLPDTGIAALSVRAVCARAKVPVGMFHYHFEGKEDFVQKLLQETYDDFFVTFSEAAARPGPPLARLRRVLVAFGRFARDHRVFYAVLARELLNGQPQAAGFIGRNFPRHAAVIGALMRECLDEGLVRPLPLPVLLAFSMAGMGVPNILVSSLERGGSGRVLGRTRKSLAGLMLSDAVIEQRADMILAGLARGGRP